MKRLFLCLIFAAIFLPRSAAQLPEVKSRRKMEQEIKTLRAKVANLEEELAEYKNAAEARDSLENRMEAIYEEDTRQSAHYTEGAPDMWYLHRIMETGNAISLDADTVSFKTDVPDSVLIRRLADMNSFIPLPYNEIVKNQMIKYSERMPQDMSSILALSQHYMPIFEESMRRYGLPLELKYLAVIESHLRPKAVSVAGAVGMWQFMYKTALGYGIRIDSYVDDRLDPYTAADAAARYLRDAYKTFGDWPLAISSYNCGPGNVSKAIKRSGNNDFWALYQYLPKETRGYVPAMVGAMYAIRYAKEYGLEPAPMSIPAHIDTFEVRNNIHFRQISEVMGISMNVLRDLNPRYYHDIIPGASAPEILRLPSGESASFIELQDSIARYRREEIFSAKVDVDRYGNSAGATVTKGFSGSPGSWTYYKVKSGDTLSRIAGKYHTTVANIKKWNSLRSDMIRPGQKLKVKKN